MKSKVVFSVLFLLVAVLYISGCGGAGGSNPSASIFTGSAKVSGVVNDVKGEPVKNASVRLVLSTKALESNLTKDLISPSSRCSVADKTEFNSYTNNFGRYQFTDVPYGEYTLSANTSDGAQVVSRFAVRAVETLAPELKLKPTGTVSGRLLDSSSNAVTAAVVYLDGTSHLSVTDSSGVYTISGVPVATDFNLCVISDRGEAEPVSVNIPALEGEIEKNLSLRAYEGQFYRINVTFTGQDSNGVIVLAVSEDGVGYIATSHPSGTLLKIYSPGNYSLFPIKNNMIIGERISKAVTTRNIKEGMADEIALSLSSGTSPSYGGLAGKIIADSGDFEVALYGDNGVQRKQYASAKSTFNFNDLPNGSYTLAVSSDKTLCIHKGISVTAPNTITLGNVRPVDVTPSITYKEGGTVKFTLNTAVSPVTEFQSPSTVKVNYSVYAKLDGGYMPLVKEDCTEARFDAASAMSGEVVAEHCAGKGLRLAAVFDFALKENAPKSFKKVFVGDSTFTPALPEITLSNLNEADGIVFFKAVSLGGSIKYLVVTESNVCLYNENGGFEGGQPTPAPIKNANVSFAETPSSKVLCLQYLDPNDKKPKIIGYKIVSKADGKAYADEIGICVLDEASVADSVNRLKIKLSGEEISFASIVSNKFYEFDRELSSFSTLTYSAPDFSFMERGVIIASYTTFTGEDNVICCLGIGNYGNDKIYLGDSDSEILFDAYYKKGSEIDIENLGYYELVSLKGNNSFPFGLTCSTDEKGREQVLVYDKATYKPRLVYDKNSLYITSTAYSRGVAVESGNSVYYYTIELNPNGHFLKVFDTDVFLPYQCIEIKQIRNSSFFLDGSISKVGRKLYVIYRGNDDRIKVMLLRDIPVDYRRLSDLGEGL